MLFCGNIPIYFKLFLKDHLQRNCQPYECETGHIRLIDVLTYSRYIYIMPRWKVYKGNLRRFEPNPPHIKISFEEMLKFRL